MTKEASSCQISSLGVLSRKAYGVCSSQVHILSTMRQANVRFVCRGSSKGSTLQRFRFHNLTTLSDIYVSSCSKQKTSDLVVRAMHSKAPSTTVLCTLLGSPFKG